MNIKVGSVIIYQIDQDYLPTLALVLKVDGEHLEVSIDGSFGKLKRNQVITIFEENVHAIELAQKILDNVRRDLK